MSKYYENSPFTTKGKHKVFNKVLYEIFDIPARNKIKNILGDFVIDNPDEKKQDLIITSDTCKYKYLELQVCAGWTQKQFPYEKLYVYERKGTYGDDTLFLVLNRILTRGYIFDRQSFRNIEPTRLKPYSKQFVYRIPWNRAMEVYIEYLDKETIELY